MIHPYNKHDYLLNRDLTPAERLEPCRAAARQARQLLEQFECVLSNAGEHLTEDQLETICRAGEMALRAAENAAFLGSSEYNPRPVETVCWRRTTDRKALLIEANWCSYNGEHVLDREHKQRLMRYANTWFKWDVDREVWDFYDGEVPENA